MSPQARALQMGRIGALGAMAAMRRAFALPDWIGLLYLDYRRYRAAGQSWLETLFFTQGFWASCVYRICHALVEWLPAGVPRMLGKTLAAALQKAVEIATGICIPVNCEIGGGLYFPRFGGIILSHGSIGRHCTIEQTVTLGIAGKGPSRGHPTIGNRVFIGAHALIVGKITIGDDAVIFPGSVVTRPVPGRAVVMGHPASVVSHEGSFQIVIYDGMEEDPERRASLEGARGELKPVVRKL
jgi:serine O-acetyltransferase